MAARTATSAQLQQMAVNTARQRKNWLIHMHYVRHEYDRCLAIVEEELKDPTVRKQCEYALYIKALIKRQNGEIQESLKLFQDATTINPHNVQNLKQVSCAPSRVPPPSRSPCAHPDRTRPSLATPLRLP